MMTAERLTLFFMYLCALLTRYVALPSSDFVTVEMQPHNKVIAVNGTLVLPMVRSIANTDKFVSWQFSRSVNTVEEEMDSIFLKVFGTSKTRSNVDMGNKNDYTLKKKLVQFRDAGVYVFSTHYMVETLIDSCRKGTVCNTSEEKLHSRKLAAFVTIHSGLICNVTSCSITYSGFIEPSLTITRAYRSSMDKSGSEKLHTKLRTTTELSPDDDTVKIKTMVLQVDSCSDCVCTIIWLPLNSSLIEAEMDPTSPANKVTCSIRAK